MDDRFEFEQFERPLTWLNFYKGSGGGFRSNGKMKLPPGHALASKFPDKVATKQEMEERAAKAGGAGGGKEEETLDQIIAKREKEVEANAARAEDMVNEINKRLPPGHYIDYNKMFSSAVDILEGRTTLDDAVNRFTSKKPIKRQ